MTAPARATIVLDLDGGASGERALSLPETGPAAQRASGPVERLTDLLAPDLAAVDAIIHARMMSAVGLIPNLASHLIDAGGKRVRPMVTLACARALGGGAPARNLAAAVEFIHTATLLHDDVVDQSALRRGKQAANLIWGNAASVLVGDFLFARAFNLMVEVGDIAILDILARAASVIAEGEVMQLSSANDVGVSEARYRAIIEAKTAALFAAAAEAGARSAGASPETGRGFSAYGLELGIAFQLVDDALDYGGRTNTLGKAVGDDFREGKLTLPVILALADANEAERAFWARTMGALDQTEADFAQALTILERERAIVRTVEAAQTAAANAKAHLAAHAPPSPYRDALMNLADFVVARAH